MAIRIRRKRIKITIVAFLLLFILFWSGMKYYQNNSYRLLTYATGFQSLQSSKDGRYKIWPNIWNPSVFKKKPDIGLATHCSLNNIHLLHDLVNVFDGPISVSIFLAAEDLYRLESELSCHSDILLSVNFHIVLPLSDPPLNDQLIFHLQLGKRSCKKGFFDMLMTQNYELKQVYPNNLLRNVAVKELSTSHALVADIDIIPSTNLYTNLIQSNLLKNDAVALVLPIFEIRDSLIDMPRNKTELQQLYDSGDARPFYHDVCPKCQQLTGYAEWKSAHNLSSRVMYRAPYEPFFVVARDQIHYDERFEQYGYNRAIQICDSHMRGINFHVYHNAFLLHKGFKVKTKFHASKAEQMQRNRALFFQARHELSKVYTENNRSCQYM